MSQASQRKVAVITDDSSSVSAATARLLANQGYNILVNNRSGADMAHAVAKKCQALDVHALAAQGNVAVEANYQALVQRAVGRWERVDALVSSAAVTKFTADGQS